MLSVELLEENTTNPNTLKFNGEQRQLKLPSPLWRNVPVGRDPARYRVPAIPKEPGFLDIRVYEPVEADRFNSYADKRCCAILTSESGTSIVIQRCLHWEVKIQYFQKDGIVSLTGPFWGFVPGNPIQLSVRSQ